tara:strand:+ start:312 stop:536 length:225 start_codon:yes stop_codon:yes gene_type:complete
MEYIVAPVITLLVALKFTDMKAKVYEKKLNKIEEKVELVRETVSNTEVELPKKVMATMMPVAKAVQKLNQQVGL